MEQRRDANYTEPTKYDSVFWVEVDRIQPNPYQPRREFDEARLKSLAESIRQYGVLQPLVVTRADVELPGGGLQSAYELIAGERRLRASKLIGLREVPVVIRVGEQTDNMKLELAIIENLQREDLNSIDRAKALAQLVTDFGLTHAEVGAKIGRSREFVSNSIRLLVLPDAIQQAVVGREISEGHARALLMLSDRPAERDTLFKEIILKKTSVRVAEQLARRIATDRIRKHDKTPEMRELEKSLTESLGTRVIIEKRPNGGRVLIEFFSPEDLSHLVATLAMQQEGPSIDALETASGMSADVPEEGPETFKSPSGDELPPNTSLVIDDLPSSEPAAPIQPEPADDDLYSVKNFSV
jgi:ParB family chromosome partitioning protein